VWFNKIVKKMENKLLKNKKSKKEEPNNQNLKMEGSIEISKINNPEKENYPTENFQNKTMIETQNIIDNDLIDKNELTNKKKIGEKNIDKELLDRLYSLLLKAHEYTAKHSSRVVKYAVLLAEKANLSKKEIYKIQVAAELHDIGKLGIGLDILNKPSKLTKKEFEVVKRHPEIGLKLLKELSFIVDVVNMVYYHHERIDGKGYPDGLKGDEIPIGAKIVAISDAYDAMTSKRIYADAMSKEDALNEMKKCADTQFDGHLVELFVNSISELKE
jgi:HD-GYP domain-containing protein (c-di-GMP phosphodiesterase class II)